MPRRHVHIGPEDPACTPWTPCESGTTLGDEGTDFADRTCIACEGGFTSHGPNATECFCAPGYEPTPDGGCADINECIEDADDCSGSTTCVNTPGSFLCVCSAGLVGDRDACESIAQLDTGVGHTCVITASGRAFCWGGNGGGQIGDGTDDNIRLLPTRAGSESDWQALAVGDTKTCGLRDGALYCWGAVGAAERVTTPTRIGTSSAWQSISLASHSCGVNAGELFCWGFNGDGRLGTGTLSDYEAEPVRIGTAMNWQAVSVGAQHTCGLRAGELYCWGSDESGQLGDGLAAIDDMPPRRIGAASDWTSIASGGGHTCGLRAGALYCWGGNVDGEVGDGTTTLRSVPTRVGAQSDWQSVWTGGSHSCGQRAGALYCWGNNRVGQLGDGTTLARSTPTLIGGATVWQNIALHADHTCGAHDGVLYCWGASTTDRKSVHG
jgi:alpha-tubulin suppressor-like RCC1 family protein